MTMHTEEQRGYEAKSVASERRRGIYDMRRAPAARHAAVLYPCAVGHLLMAAGVHSHRLLQRSRRRRPILDPVSGMQTQPQKTTVEKLAYPVCIASIVAFVPLAVAGMWVESDTIWKLAWTFGIVAFAAALVLSATRAYVGGTR